MIGNLLGGKLDFVLRPEASQQASTIVRGVLCACQQVFKLPALRTVPYLLAVRRRAW